MRISDWSSDVCSSDLPVDALQARYGTALTDLILYGTFSSIPKIFGSDGIALYTRGDINPRVPAFLDPSQAPVWNLAETTMQGIGKVIDQMMPGGVGVSDQTLMETLGTYLTNRPLKGAFELAAGYSVDRRGNVISDDVRNNLSVVSRFMGLRPLNEAKMMDVLRRQKTTELSQLEKRTRLREGLKTAFRGEDIDTDMLIGAIEDYEHSGGNPEYF